MSERRAYNNDLPGSRRSPCLGCDRQVVTARDPHVLIGGKRDGSLLMVIDAAPQCSWVTDPDRVLEPGQELLGVAHRACIDLARQRLQAQQVALPKELPHLINDEAAPEVPSLHLPPVPGLCAFCGTAGTGDEHVWPKWISRELSCYGTFTTASPRGPRRMASLQVTAPVCRICNNRWLSVLENDARHVLGPMLHGRERTLRPEEQRLLAAWAVKTALMLDLSAGNPLVPVGFYHDFRQRRRALDSHIVLLAGYRGSHWAAWAHHTGLHLGIPEKAPPNAFVTTFTVFRVVFQVLGHFTIGTARLNDARWPLAPALARIWPPRDDRVDWPPGRLAFDDQSLSILADSIGAKQQA